MPSQVRSTVASALLAAMLVAPPAFADAAGIKLAQAQQPDGGGAQGTKPGEAPPIDESPPDTAPADSAKPGVEFEGEADALPETPKLPVKSEQFPELFKKIEANAAARSAHRSCPADVFDKARPFWRRWWDSYVGDTDLSLETCGEDPMSCAFMCLDLRGADACFTTARLIQDNAERKEQAHAQTLFAYACTLGFPAGCTNRAAGVKNGDYEGDPFRDPAKPETASCLFRSFSLACERGDAWGCTMHGMSLQYGDGVPADADAARKAYDRSCEIDPAFDACGMAREQVKEMDAPQTPDGAPEGEAPPLDGKAD